MLLQSCEKSKQMKKIKELPKTGIVVPSFNQGKYIEKAIRSILENAEHCPIKLIIMDGGSTDETLDIVRRYSDKIHYWQSKPDGGQAAAINAGIELLSDCEIVTWLNSDDEYENDWSVYTIVCAMQESGAQVAYGRSYLMDKDSNVTGEYPVCAETAYERLSVDYCLSQPSVFIRKAAWDKAGGLNAKLQMCLDYDMWIRLSREYPFTYVDAVIGNTRIYDQTKTSQCQDRHLLEGIYILNQHYGLVPRPWVSEKYVRDKFGGNPITFLQKIYKRIDFMLRYEKIKTACIMEAERVINR